MENDTPTGLIRNLAAFKEHLLEVDEVALVTLKGHLLIEASLDRIIELMFFHPEHVSNARLSFFQKMNIARAFCLRKDDEGTWKAIADINSLRNEIAHNLKGEKLARKIAEVRHFFIAEFAGIQGDHLKDAPDQNIIMFACAACTGFLSEFESDTRALRRHIDALDAVLNPDKRGVHPSQP